MAFVLDSFLGWVFKTLAAAADAEMNDDTTLREQLLEAEMQREMGGITDEEFAELEADILQRIREIKERKSGGSAPLELSAPIEAEEGERFHIDAEVSGDFYGPPTTIDTTPVAAETIDREPADVEPVAPKAAKPARRRATKSAKPGTATKRTRAKRTS